MQAPRSHLTPLRVIAVTLALITGYIWIQGGDKFVIESLGELMMFPVCLASWLPSPWDQRASSLITHQNVFVALFSSLPIVALLLATIVAIYSVIRHSLILSLLSTGMALAMFLTFHLTKHNFITYCPVGAARSSNTFP